MDRINRYELETRQQFDNIFFEGAQGFELDIN